MLILAVIKSTSSPLMLEIMKVTVEVKASNFFLCIIEQLSVHLYLTVKSSSMQHEINLINCTF